jgi:hypothetical protein
MVMSGLGLLTQQVLPNNCCWLKKRITTGSCQYRQVWNTLLAVLLHDPRWVLSYSMFPHSHVFLPCKFPGSLTSKFYQEKCCYSHGVLRY